MGSSCTLFDEHDPIALDMRFLSEDVLHVSVQWHELPEFLSALRSIPGFEQTLKYTLVVRKKGSLSGQINSVHQFIFGYSPYNDLYYLSRPDYEEYFTDQAALSEYLEMPFEFTLSLDELPPGSEFILQVNGQVTRLSENSVFQHWFRIIDSYVYSGYGEIRGVRDE